MPRYRFYSQTSRDSRRTNWDVTPDYVKYVRSIDDPTSRLYHMERIQNFLNAHHPDEPISLPDIQHYYLDNPHYKYRWHRKTHPPTYYL